MKPLVREKRSRTQEMLRIKKMSIVVSLALSSAVLLVYQAVTLRTSLSDDANTQANMIADNVAASIMFNDKAAASEILHPLRKVAYIESVNVYDTGERMFASYAKPGLSDAERTEGTLANARAHAEAWLLTDVFAVAPIVLKGRTLGHVVLVAQTDDMLSQLLHYGGFLLAASVGAVWGAFALTSRMGARVAEAEKELEYLASTDPLTGLPNRREFYDELDRRLHLGTDGTRRMALILVDLDDFKSINDTMGHGAGDALLKRVGTVLRHAVRSTDVVSRIGGDEFAVLVELTNGKSEGHEAAQRIARALSRPFRMPHTSIVATASVGVSVFPDDAKEAAALVSSADIALYAAKSKGKNNAVEFHPNMTVEARRRARLETDLRHAIAVDALDLVYQPQFDCRTGAFIGAEALVRWVHPTEGTISPAEFIPIAEGSELIVTLGHWVLRRACRDAARWNVRADAGFHVAVNVSARQLRQPEFGEDVHRVLAESALPAQLLELELTESQLMVDMATGIDAMQRLRAAGVRLSLDDFGTGYSSLSYLQSFPVTRLKIDRSFVHPLPGSGQPIVTAIISMAHSFGITVVAEGVESPDQLAWLVDAGCDIVQGFLTGRPTTFDGIIALVDDDLSAARSDLAPDVLA